MRLSPDFVEKDRTEEFEQKLSIDLYKMLAGDLRQVSDWMILSVYRRDWTDPGTLDTGAKVAVEEVGIIVVRPV